MLGADSLLLKYNDATRILILGLIVHLADVLPTQVMPNVEPDPCCQGFYLRCAIATDDLVGTMSIFVRRLNQATVQEDVPMASPPSGCGYVIPLLHESKAAVYLVPGL
jgi:hypothetical protein